MREILFRGKSKHKWCEGGLLYDEENNKAFIATHFEDGAAYINEISPETVGQYTGFTDKNGKKVFEGDILKNGFGGIRVVVFMNSRFILKNINNNQCSSWAYMDKHEIVGNIHDNPELLKGE
jgi:uncharacterized phage protein (TIGR01671 family)